MAMFLPCKNISLPWSKFLPMFFQRTDFFNYFFSYDYDISGLPSQSLFGTLSPAIGNLSNLQSV